MKQLMIAVTIVGFVSLIGFGVVMANATTPPGQPLIPTCPNCDATGAGQTGSGYLHDYMSAALANALGMDVDEFLARRDAGDTLFDIATELGIDLDTLTDLRIQARQQALEQAYADGVLTEEQYQFMLERANAGTGMGLGMGTGNGQGNMQNNGRGQRGGGMWNADGTLNPDCPNYQAVP